MNSEPAQKRPLSSLMPEECQTLFALAFGYAPPITKLKTFTLGGHYPLTIQDATYALILNQNGSLLAQRQNDQSALFNAYKVVGYLASLNIAFGPDQPARRRLSDLSNDEGYAIFMAAFGQVPQDDIIISPWNSDSCITISDGHLLLTLTEQGQVTAHKPREAYDESIFWPSIKPENLINCLNGLNVRFSSEPITSGK